MPKRRPLQISIDSAKSSDVTIIGSRNIGVEEKPRFLASANRFTKAVQKRYSLEGAELANIMLDTITKHIEAGDQIAFVSRTKDGKVRLTTLSIEKEE